MRQKYLFSKGMAALLLIAGLGGCISQNKTVENGMARTRPQQNLTQMNAPDDQGIDFEWLTLPSNSGAQPDSLTVLGISADGHTVIGTARRLNSQGESSDTQPLEAFWWDMACTSAANWVWLDAVTRIHLNEKDHIDNLLVGADATASTVFGRHWVWQRGQMQLVSLGQQFWAYAVNHRNQILGVGTDNKILLWSADGQVLQQWAVQDLFELDGLGRVRGDLWFSGNGAVIVSTLTPCLKNAHCEQAQFIHWSPEGGKHEVWAQLPIREDIFIQGNPGAQKLSRNGQWTAGFVQRGLYLWNTESGQMTPLGGFEYGGDVMVISDDGLLVMGRTIDTVSNKQRDWIWTATEGLGWFDEWLRDHGVSQALSFPGLQSRFISSDRHLLYGVADFSGQGFGLRWWRARLPENLRVLIR